jgi:branched-chain amino acid transport system substrate-binding protein
VDISTQQKEEKEMKLSDWIKTLGLTLSLFLLMPPGAMAESKPLVIGLQGPITGPWAYEGQMAKQSCEIAATLINEKGGILGGRMVEVRVMDDEGQPKSGAMAATKLCGQRDVVASVSTYGSSICEAAMSIYEKRKKVNIGYGVTAVRLTQKGFKYFFRTCGRDDAQGHFFAKIANEKFNAKRIAIMHDNTAFGKGLAEDARKGLTSLKDAGKIEVVYYDAITPGEKDFHVPLTQLREAHPDLWYFTGYYAEAALLVSQAREIGVKCPFVGGNAAINDEFVKIAGLDMAKGCFMTNEPLPQDLPSSAAKEFLKAYKDKYGEIPSSPWPVYAADALNIIAYAVDKAESTDSKVLAGYLRDRVDAVPGVTGKIGFTPQGDREGVPFYLYIIDNNGQIVISQ